MKNSINLLQEAKRLIAFNTVTTQSNAECALYVGRLLTEHGFRVQCQEYREGGQLFLNVLGTLGPAVGAPLLLAAHLDTVEAGDPALWTKTGRHPWKATVRGDALYGLGSADDKLDFLCKLIAITQVPAARLTRPVLLLGTFGEERGLLGASRFCQEAMTRPLMALVGEPSSLQIVTRHKGLLVGELDLLRRGVYRTETIETVYDVTVDGMAAHSSTPALGQNAVLRLLDLLKTIGQPASGLRLLDVHGGTAANIIPARCTAQVSAVGAIRHALLTRRHGVTIQPRRLPAGWHPTVPWTDIVAYLDGLTAVLAPYQKARDRAFAPPLLTSAVTRLRVVEGALVLTFDVRSLPGQDLGRIAQRCEHLGWTLFGPPGDRWQFRRERQNPGLHTAPAAPVVALLRAAMRKARVPATLAAKAGCSEAGWYQMVGIPSVVFGPGQAQGNIHQPNEHTSLHQVRRAIAVYRAAIERCCT
ncbi:MAG: hypothetical protein A3C53_03340 [Omnitrophica WOR_2 bacterium RIFCSPHIGHO2_02_FULL_68_15]|nr:MAG: hypothetical protein A3C53_03340 [Omnitrophica WOR_2 bacterium RIFCSPHIGHO2_02_FULL_68_15]